jgi:hypothetical protein
MLTLNERLSYLSLQDAYIDISGAIICSLIHFIREVWNYEEKPVYYDVSVWSAAQPNRRLRQLKQKNVSAVRSAADFFMHKCCLVSISCPIEQHTGGNHMQQLPDMNQLIKLARSPAGQKLLAMLQSGNPSDLNAITAQAAAGNMQEAGKLLSGLLSAEEMQTITKELEKQI